MQMPGSIAAANLPFDDRPSDAAFGHVVFGGNAAILRPLKDPPGMPTENAHTGTVPAANCPRCQLGDCPRCLIVIACVSIASNIAEGSKRLDDDFRRFLSYSLGSLAELDTQLMIAEMQGYAPYAHEMKSRIIGLMAAIRKFAAALRK